MSKYTIANTYKFIIIEAITASISLFGGCQRLNNYVVDSFQTINRPVVLIKLKDYSLGLVTSKNRYSVWKVKDSPSVIRSRVLEGNIGIMLPISDILIAYSLYNDEQEPDCIIVYDIDKGRICYTCNLGISSEVTALAADSNGHTLAWIEEKKWEPQKYRMRSVDIRTGKIICDLEAPLVVPGNQRIECLAISPDKKTIAFASRGEGGAGVIDLVSKTVLWHHKRTPWEGGIWQIKYCPDSVSFYATDNGGQLTRFEVRTGKILWRTEIKLSDITLWREQARDRLMAIDISPDGKYVAVGADYTRKVMIWEVSSGKSVGEIKVSKWPVESILVFSHDGKGIWAAGSQDRLIRYFPLAGGLPKK